MKQEPTAGILLTSLFDTIVVADNCTDNTARIAEEMVVYVLESDDLKRIGKGYALKFALEKIDIDMYDAVFIIDADSVVRKDLLKQLDRLVREGRGIIQCYNGIDNSDESWFTRLLHVSRIISNEIYHPAKQLLGFSSSLMGNGMCICAEIILRYGWEAFTVGEDWEYYAKLLLEGETIAFAQNARVYHRESSSLKQATSQRMRWSSGRFAIAWKYGLRLFGRGFVERDIRKIDASLPLIFPNPSLGLNMTLIGIFLSVLLPLGGGKIYLIVWLCCLMASQCMIFFVGIMYTRNRLKSFLSLFVAPLFLIWKMGIDLFSILGAGRSRWIRTKRKI